MKTRHSRLYCLFLAGLLLLTSVFFQLAVFADSDEQVITATINYYYYDEKKPDKKGTSPFNSFVANMPKGSDPITQRSPIVPGFSPCDISKNELQNVTINFDEDNDTDVFYFPAEVDYVIRLYMQNLEDNDYVVSSVIHSKGITGSEPVEFGEDFKITQLQDAEHPDGRTLEEAYDGFTLMYHVPEVIAADGSTEFECYYDRNYYLVSLDLGEGGYGVEPLYIPFEYPLHLETPKRTGYNFVRWEITNPDENDAAMAELPDKMPAHNIHCKAIWAPKEDVKYTIVYCNAEVDDGSGVTKYNHWGATELSAQPDTKLNLSEIIEAHKDDTETLNLTDYPYFTFDPEATAAKNSSEINVKSDGSTIIRLYYKRNQYKLRFVYVQHSDTTTITAGEPVTSIQTDHQYALVNTNNYQSHTPKALTNLPYSNTDKMRKLVNFDNKNFDYLWKFIPVEGGYNIQYSDGTYLSADFNASGDGKPTIVSDTPLLFQVSPYGESENAFLIYTIHNNKKYYLNDKSNVGNRVQVYPSEPAIEGSNKNPNRWQLFDNADKTISTSVSAIKAASGTGNGDFPKDAKMTYSLPEMPAVDTSSGITTGSYIQNNITYEYVELVAEYNANIEDLWPAAVIGKSGTYSFGSWSTQKGSGYRGSGDKAHANVVGRYPYMSSDMIVHPEDVYDPDNPDQIAQLLWAWWGTQNDNVSEHNIKIYFEALEGQTPDVTINGIDYVLDHTVEAVAAHNSNTRIDPFVYRGFTIIPEEASGHAQSWGEPAHHQENGIWTTDFHYTRKSHNLSFWNYNTAYGTAYTLKYGYPLAAYEPAGEPPYPEGLKPDSYEFAGWYDSDTFDGEAFNFETGTMPDTDVVLYARWKPKTFDVNYYNDESDYQNGEAMIHYNTGDYGEKLDTSEAEDKLHPPQITNSTGTYDARQAGWYYYDDSGEIHAFDPETMTVSGGMDLFMKWSSTVPANFTVHYQAKDQNGHLTTIAPDTTGYSFVGLTRTFKAKVENELNDGYRECYFPDRSSTSILMKADQDANVKTFFYTYRDSVPYTVRYIAKDGENAGKEIYETKKVTNNKKAVVTEKFEHIPNYIPTSYYITKTLIVSDNLEEQNAQNVITFYYHVDTVNMPYHIKYMVEDDNGSVTQEIDGKTYHFKEKNFIDGYAEHGHSKAFAVNSYAGYTVSSYKEVVYDTSDNKTEGPLTALSSDSTSITITMAESANSQELHIFYLKKSYPVKLLYQISSEDRDKIKEFNEQIAALNLEGLQHEGDPIEIDGVTCYKVYYQITDPQKFNTTYTKTAPKVEGFIVAGGETKSRVISDDDADMSHNRIVFNYTAMDEVLYYYYPVIPDGASYAVADAKEIKLLSLNEETVDIGTRPQKQVTAKLDHELYRFIGWYQDEACTVPVNATSPDNIPVLSGTEKNTIQPLAANENKDYFAKYDYRRGDLTINLTGEQLTTGRQPFILHVKGRDSHNDWIDLAVCIDPAHASATIKDLPVGNYTITQNAWAWRYEIPDAQTATVSENETETVTFTETIKNKKWLDGNARQPNTFSAS